jgi:hypothetical protein
MSSPTYTSLFHDTKHCLKTKTTHLNRTPPLIMHSVVGRFVFPLWKTYEVFMLLNCRIAEPRRANRRLQCLLGRRR